MDQGKDLAKVIVSGNTTGISDGYFKQRRLTEACIIESNNNMTSRIYAVPDKPGNKIN